MKFELTKWNIDKALETLKDLKDKSIMVDDISLYGVTSIGIEQSEWYDGDPIPEEGYDGGKHDEIIVTFNFEGGKAARHYCSDTHVCHFWNETNDLICFEIKDIKEYVEREKFDLDFRLQEYEKYMSK